MTRQEKDVLLIPGTAQ